LGAAGSPLEKTSLLRRSRFGYAPQEWDHGSKWCLCQMAGDPAPDDVAWLA
jgi:hypothetical protein